MSKPTPSTQYCFLQPDGSEVVLSAHEATRRYAVDGFLKADQAEHARSLGLPFVWYFNLGQTTHQAGLVYGMTPVLRPGRRATETQEEKLPLLAGEGLTRFRCLQVDWQPAFPDELATSVLEQSLLDDKSLSGLRASLMQRYAPAAGTLTEVALLARGLTATLLERLD